MELTPRVIPCCIVRIFKECCPDHDIDVLASKCTHHLAIHLMDLTLILTQGQVRIRSEPVNIIHILRLKRVEKVLFTFVIWLWLFPAQRQILESRSCLQLCPYHMSVCPGLFRECTGPISFCQTEVPWTVCQNYYAHKDTESDSCRLQVCSFSKV